MTIGVMKNATGLDVLKETIIFATAIVVAVGAWVAIDKLNHGKRMEAEHQKEQSRLASEIREKEKEEDLRRKEEERLAQRVAAEVRREQERKAKEEESRLRKLELERNQKLKALKKRYEDITRVLERCKIEYWRNAPEDERKARKTTPCVYHCLVARQIDDEVSVIEMKFDPVTNAVYSIITPNADPQEIEKAEFEGMVKGRPYFVVRDEANRPADVLYLCLPADKSGTIYSMIKSFEEFNPSKIELGALYDQLRDKMPSRAPNFAYVVFLHEKGHKKGTPICEVSFGESVSYETIRLAIENELMKEKLMSLPTRKKVEPKKRHGFANHSTISKTSLDGKFTPGEFHGTSTRDRKSVV